MKTKIISIVVMLMVACNVMGEDLAYFYLNNGRCIPLPVSVLSKMEVSKLDMNNIQHSDYQTQKIVTNDTTVFISLSEIDSIVFDKKEITDYPKTEREIKESIDLSNSIASKSKQIVDSLADLGEMDINVIVEEIRKLDGVIVANADSSQSVINIIQKDGICINKLMKIDESTYIDENEEVYYNSISPILSPSPRRIEMSQGDNASYLASHGQALILAPFQSSFGKIMNYFREQFEYAYDKGPIVYENHSADILKFKGDNLSKYDFLFIDTHGGCGSFMAPRSDYANGWLSAYNWLLSELYSESYTTALCSRSEYNYDFIDNYINKEKLLTWDQIFIGEEDGKLYVAMDHSFIDGYSFDGCIVFASACLAGRDKTSDTSLMKAFLDNGAALYAGFEVVINSAVCESIDTGIIGLFAHGVSFQDAKQYWINSSYLKKTVDTASKTGLYKTEELDPQRFVYRVNPKLSNSKIFLKNPYPSLYPAVVDKETIGFAWETELEGFTTYSQTIELVNFQERKAKKNRFNVQFNLVNDLYVDGKLYKCANEEKSLTIPANEFSVGDHSWYVTSSLYDDENNIVCTYSSKEEKFNIPEPVVSSSESYAVYKAGTLTFYHDQLKNSRDGSVYGLNTEWNAPDWYYSHDENSKVVFDKSFADARPTSTCFWFTHKKNLTSIEGIEYLNTSEVTVMYYMFGDCENLTSLDVSSFDTRNVVDMSYMFDNCNNLTSLDVSSFDTRNVTNMVGMFGDCENLTFLDVSSFDTRNVTDMSVMFDGCRSLTSLDLSNFDTRNVTAMDGMFDNCENLTSLDVSSFDTRNVVDMSYMFYDCPNLKTLDVSNFNMAACKNSEYMFRFCHGLNSLSVSSTMENLDESACEYVGYFTPCTIIAPDGFNFGVDTSGSSFEWKSGKFTFGNSDGICPDQHHPHMIDLGLPSGKKWACCNVGASSPEKNGGFYAWGETSVKNVYDWNSYIYCDGSWETCYDIGDDISGTNYDVAHVHGKWGGNWRMPNMSEAKELFSYCSHEETYYNGVYGYMFTGPNGNSIFIPAAGYKNESTHYRNGDYGALWLSTAGDDYYEAIAFRLLVNNPFTGSYSWSRNRGLSVRPIHP